MVKIVKPDSQSEDDGDYFPASNLVAKKYFVWKWDKCFEKSALKKCSLAEKGIVNINLENWSPFQVFTGAIDL